jgi:hypothetical protein
LIYIRNRCRAKVFVDLCHVGRGCFLSDNKSRTKFERVEFKHHYIDNAQYMHIFYNYDHF